MQKGPEVSCWPAQLVWSAAHGSPGKANDFSWWTRLHFADLLQSEYSGSSVYITKAALSMKMQQEGKGKML